jgi:hypothetical protein
LRAAVAGIVRPRRSTWFTRWLNIGPGRVAKPVPPAVPPLEKGAVTAALTAAATTAPAPVPATEVVAGAPILEADAISVSFGGVKAVNGVSLALLDGEILGLVGPNGSGKTTFLNALSGIVPARGSLRVAGREIGLGKPGRLRRLEVMRAFQAPQTYEDLTCCATSTPVGTTRSPRSNGSGSASSARSPRGGSPTVSAGCSSSRARWPRTRASCSSTSRPPG